VVHPTTAELLRDRDPEQPQRSRTLDRLLRKTMLGVGLAGARRDLAGDKVADQRAELGVERGCR